MAHKLRVIEGGEKKSALAAKRRLFLREELSREKLSDIGIQVQVLHVPTVLHGQVRFLVMHR
jgi:hypothetical protein